MQTPANRRNEIFGTLTQPIVVLKAGDKGGIAAARDGDKADALRLLARTANVSPTTTIGLAE